MSQVGDLKACPLCGAVAEVEDLGDPDDFFVACTGCGLQQIAKYSRAGAVEAWNRRAPTDLERTLGEAAKAGVELVEWLSREITECQRLSDDVAGHEHWERIAGSKYDGRLASYHDQFSQALAKYHSHTGGA